MVFDRLLIMTIFISIPKKNLCKSLSVQQKRNEPRICLRTQYRQTTSFNGA
jgi:hypothetical protein